MIEKYTVCHWIVGPRYDLIFFVFSAVLCFVFLFLYEALIYFGFSFKGQALLVTYGLYTILFDHPHIFQTFSRTHFDKIEFKRRKWFHLGLPPLYIILGLIATWADYGNELLVFAALYGSWHIIRQHWGFLKAYQVRNKDVDVADQNIDALLFYSGMFCCFFSDYSEDNGPVYIFGDHFVLFPHVPSGISEVIWAIFWLSMMIFLLRQVQRIKSQQRINVPKILFLCAALGSHMTIFMATSTTFMVAEAIETSYHNVQYQGWMMHYQKTRFKVGWSMCRQWLLMSFIYGLLAGGLELAALYESQNWAKWLYVVPAMLVIYHYTIDGYVWRFRSSPELNVLLGSKKEKLA
jgi:hypothetical protein